MNTDALYLHENQPFYLCDKIMREYDIEVIGMASALFACGIESQTNRNYEEKSLRFVYLMACLLVFSCLLLELSLRPVAIMKNKMRRNLGVFICVCVGLLAGFVCLLAEPHPRPVSQL